MAIYRREILLSGVYLLTTHVKARGFLPCVLINYISGTYMFVYVGTCYIMLLKSIISNGPIMTISRKT